MRMVRLAVVFALTGLFIIGFAQKRPIDASTYDEWKSIRATKISRDGHWLLYVTNPQEGDGVATIRNVDSGQVLTIPRGTNLSFSRDSKFVVGSVVPPFLEVRKAKRDKKKPEESPKNTLAIVDLTTGKETDIPQVTSFDLAKEDHGWILYKPEPPKPEPPKPASAKPEDKKPAAAKSDEKKPKKPGDPYVLRELATGKEERIENVSAAVFNKYGDALAYSTATKDGAGDGVTLWTAATDKQTVVVAGEGKYPHLALSADGKKLAFTTDRSSLEPSKEPAQKVDPKKPSIYSLYLWSATSGRSTEVGQDSMPKGWSINEFQNPQFSEKGTRLLYYTSPRPEPESEEKPDDEKVSVDIWNWKDAKLQSQQLVEAKQERERGFLAVLNFATGKSFQLATPDLPSVALSDKGDGRYGTAETDFPYLRESSWVPGPSDLYVVDASTGQHRKLLTNENMQVSLSPDGNTVAAYLGNAKKWVAFDSATGASRDLAVPFPVANELNDVPDAPSSYGSEGWTKDGRILLRDRYDVWACDPSGRMPAQNLTNGRLRSLMFHRVDLDPEEPRVDLSDALFTAMDERSKDEAIYRLRAGVLAKIDAQPKHFAGFLKAQDAKTLVYTRQDFIEYPNLWLTDTEFSHPVKISDTNPQQKNFNWGRDEIVSWTSNDGTLLRGILVKPENFDYAKKYPLITYYYERDSDTLNMYHSPAPSASTVNLTYLASNGYCVFVPDISYKLGYPGPSALASILPGVQSIVSRGYIDPKRLGLQGQSWGGYETAYLVTQTDMFAAASAGAPVGDMFSAYGGIREGTGLVRQFQYEHTQSRIGATPWEAPLKYIENSPIFWADRIKTPLLIMSNDKDGSVPHSQGVELFTALRRLDRPSWMVVYNGEDHNIMERKNRKDFSLRLYQFFDYYLKGGPLPKWMDQGVSALEKGKDMGLGTSAPANGVGN